MRELDCLKWCCGKTFKSIALKKTIYIIAIIILVSSLVSMIIYYSFVPSRKETVILEKPIPVSNTDLILVLDNSNVLSHNKYSGIVQCFSPKGDFLWGINLQDTPNIDSTAVSYDGFNVYMLEIRTSTIYAFDEIGIFEERQAEESLTTEQFYEKYPLGENVKMGKYTGQNIKLQDKQKLNVSLKTTYLPVSPLYSLIGFAFSAILFMFAKN